MLVRLILCWRLESCISVLFALSYALRLSPIVIDRSRNPIILTLT